jgi:hypothetical protein
MRYLHLSLKVLLFIAAFSAFSLVACDPAAAATPQLKLKFFSQMARTASIGNWIPGNNVQLDTAIAQVVSFV